MIVTCPICNSDCEIDTEKTNVKAVHRNVFVVGKGRINCIEYRVECNVCNFTFIYADAD